MLRAVVPVAEQTDDFQDIAAVARDDACRGGLARAVAAGCRGRADDASSTTRTSTRSSAACGDPACGVLHVALVAPADRDRGAAPCTVAAWRGGGTIGSTRCVAALDGAQFAEHLDASVATPARARCADSCARRPIRRSGACRREHRRHERPPSLRAPAVLLAPLRLLRLRHRRRPGRAARRLRRRAARRAGARARSARRRCRDRLRRRRHAVVHRSGRAAARARGAARRRPRSPSRRTRRP